MLFTGKTDATVLEEPSFQLNVEIKKKLGQVWTPVIELGPRKPVGSLEISYSDS